jgi:futalosine hydrolase
LAADTTLAEQPWILHRLTGAVDAVVTGVGKANAAGAVGRFADPDAHGAVLSVGIAGALPASEPGLRTCVVATRCLYADEGLDSPAGFRDCASMGFPLGPFDGPGPTVPAWLVESLRPLADVAGPIATVSTCSGTDHAAATVRERTGAVAEAMEGAAVAHAAARLGIAAGELRVISNTTGDRPRQTWDLPGALRVLAGVIGRL